MVRRTINWPILIGTLVAFSATSATLLLAHSWQMSKTSEMLLARATVAEKESNPVKAVEYLELYLRLSPEDGAAKVRLAEVYGRLASTGSQRDHAVDLYYRALATSPKDREPELRETLSELLLKSRRFIEAEAEARRVLEFDPLSPAGSRLRALALYGQIDAGMLATSSPADLGLVAKLEEARSLNPTQISLPLALAAVYRERPEIVRGETPEVSDEERQTRADEFLDTFVHNNPNSADGRMARFLYRRQYNRSGSGDDLSRALELAPRDPIVLRTAAIESLRLAEPKARKGEVNVSSMEHYQQAQELFKRLIEVGGNSPEADAFLGLGDSLAGQDLEAEAILTWRKAIQLFSQLAVQAKCYARIADLHLAKSRVKEAEEPLQFVDRILADMGTDTPRDERLALARQQGLRRGVWHLKQDEPLEAVLQLRSVLAMHSKTEASLETVQRAWLLIAEAYTKLDEWYESARAFDEATALQPDVARTYLAAANSWLLAGRADLASDRAEKSLQLEPTVDGWFIQATAQFRLQVVQHARDRAWGQFKQALAALQANSVGLAWPWRIDFLHADYRQIEAGQTGKSVEDAREAAAIVLREAEAKHYSSPDFLSQLSLVYEQLELPKEADRIVEEIRTGESEPFVADLVSAHLAIVRKDYERATQILDNAGKSAEAKISPRLQAERLALALGKPDLNAAKSILLEEYAKHPRNLSLLRRIADLEMERADWRALESWEGKFDALGPAGKPFAHYYRACRMMFSSEASREKNLRAALAEQSQLFVLRPRWPETHSLLGMIEQRLGRSDQALDAYELAVRFGESRLSVFEQLISLLESKQRTAEAEQYVSKLGARLATSQQLTELGSAQRLRRNDRDEALRLARDRVQRNPDDARARVWLGRVLMVCDRAHEAEQAFQQAVDLAPDQVTSWNGLFSYYVRSGVKEKARETLVELARKVKLDSANISYVLAQGYEFVGDLDLAKEHYKETAAKLPDDLAVQLRLAAFYLRVDPVEAETYLKRALDISAKTDLDRRMVAAARRMMAALLFSRAENGNFVQAERYLKDADVDMAVVVEDRRLNALLLVQYGGLEKVERAIGLLESVVENGGGVPGDRIVLAQLYESQARSAKDKTLVDAKLELAKKHLLFVVGRPNPQFGHITLMVEYLLRRNDLAEAEYWLERFEDALRSGIATPEAITQLILLRIRHGSSEGRCEAWLAKLQKADRDVLRPLALRARLLKAGGRAGEIRDLVEKQADEILAHAKEDSEKTRIYRGLGDIYLAVKDFPGAEKWYKRYVEVAPDRYDLVVSAIGPQPGRLAEAVALCEAAAKTDDTSKPAIVMASVLMENGAKADVVRQVEPLVSAAVKRFPKDLRLLYSASLVHLSLGKYDEAVQGFRKVIELSPKHVAAMNNLALLLGERPSGREEALKLIDQALAMAGSNPGLLDTKGTIYIYQQQPDKAIEFLLPATQGAAVDPRFNFHLAVAYQRTGEIVKAREELDKALGQELESQVLTETDRLLLQDLLTVLPKK